MAGLASRRCDACRELVMVSDRGRVLTVGAARGVGSGHDGDDRAICPCGTLVSWPRPTTLRTDGPVITPDGALAQAHPRHLETCMSRGHDPLHTSVPPGATGRVVTYQNVCKRCGLVFAVDVVL